MLIRVFGPGCQRCQELEARTIDALAELQWAADVRKVADVPSIAAAGVLRTPALEIDGKLVLQGRVPGITELKRILGKAREQAEPVSPPQS
jgi:small redox-active disulfide protein 2